MTTTIYSARKILTMNPRNPVATHVAVRDGWILGAGSLEDIKGWGEHELDERFAERIIMPGFVEGHCHSWEGSAWKDTYLGFFDRTAPDEVVHAGLKTLEEVAERLIAAAEQLHDPNEVLMGWGFDPIYYDRRMVAEDLDGISTQRPVIVMHQSGHIINTNSEALRRAGISRETDVQGLLKDANGNPTGELLGPALYSVVLRAVGKQSVINGDDEESLWRFAQSACRAGVTTATDLANELSEDTVSLQVAVTSNKNYPLRIIPAFFATGRSPEEGVSWVQSLCTRNHERLRYGIIKLIVDGSIQGFTARIKWPGYYNGHENGLWYIAPEQLPDIIETYHRAGLQIHLHTNGDEATETAIDAIDMVLQKHPAPDARFTLQHCQMAHEAHYRRMARIGICANLFLNHLYYWGDQHYSITMGPERTERMNAAGTAQRLGVPFAIHSDAPVTHLAPLFTAWCAVNRLSASGQLLGESERITVSDALHAITIGAAFTLKLDAELGSIEAGKRADFAILEDDPTTVDPMALKDVAVWGTVVGGKVFSPSTVAANG